MKSDKWPIEIDGKTYYVQGTFSNQPGIYVYHKGDWRHCDSVEGEDMGAPMLINPSEGDVAILASISRA